MNSTVMLMISAALAAILHTLVPDHEIPLAMIGRAQNWTVRKMAGITLIAGAIHISVSMGIGVIALIASVTLSQFVANSAQQISGFLLVAFGIAYAFFSWRRKRDSHSHSHLHSHVEHPVVHAPHETKMEKDCTKESAVSWGTWIVAIVGIAPCFTLIPVLVAAVPYGATTTLLVMLSYAFATIGMMVVLTSIALKAIGYVIRLAKIEKHMEILAGAVIFAVGVWLLVEIKWGIP